MIGKRVWGGILVFAMMAGSFAETLETQKTSTGGVAVAVTPLKVGAGASNWQFRVSLDTHAGDLTDDLVAASVLSDGMGTERPATAWEGSGRGGHHRSGVLTFDPIQPHPERIELRIRRPGEALPRAFRWKLR